ncbi:hypothetical protein [Crocosphaera sp.]|uniref:hypothetical protein n=1 Tax=Crocosphaera sp. TaxID=2729996 RepID=UPI002631EEC7|nr:hypothetical protein [Crocosphaera sp.]MDJ0578384.1 hypothetical protein [Crocosphaera sp.]
MTETPPPNTNQSEDSGSLVPYSQSLSDIDIIKQDIAQSIVSAKNLEEKRELLKMRAELEYQIETSKNNQYQRDLQQANEVTLKLGSVSSIVIGFVFIGLQIFVKLYSTGYVGIFFILLGLVTLLEYSPSDVSSLLESFGNYMTKTNKNLPPSNSEENQS